MTYKIEINAAELERILMKHFLNHLEFERKDIKLTFTDEDGNELNVPEITLEVQTEKTS